MKSYPARLSRSSLALAFILAWAAGCAKGPSGGVGVEATLAGAAPGSATASSRTLTLTHRYGASLPRVAEAPGPGIDDLRSMTLRVTSLTGGPFGDTFVLASVVDDADPAAGAATALRRDGNDPDWARRRRGELALLRMPVGARNEGRRVSRTFAPGSRPSAGSAWLVRLEGGDPVIPWTIDAGDARCRAVVPAVSLVAPPPGQARDCFDLATLAGMVLAHVAKAVVEGLDDGPLPALVTAAEHALSIVPALDPAGGAGFGLIYSAELRVGEGGGAAQATLIVPVSVLLRSARVPGDPGLEIEIAPLGAAPWSAIGVGRVTLEYPDRGIGDRLAREIRAVVVESLERAALPPLAVDGQDVPAEQAIGRMIAAIAPPPAGGANPSGSFDVAALPADRPDTTEVTVPTRVLSLPRVTTRIATGGALGAAPPSRAARPRAVAAGNGAMNVTTALDPTGGIRRVTALSPVRAGDPYELRILR